MLPHHARTVNSMSQDVIDYLLWYFDARPGPRRREVGWLPSVSLAEAGVGQADCVLALLRAEHRPFLDAAEILVGHGITHCPPCLRPSAPLVFMDEESPDERRISIVAARNPRLPRTGAHYRFALFREGMTVQQFLVRGGTRRDVRLAKRHGWIELREDAR